MNRYGEMLAWDPTFETVIHIGSDGESHHIDFGSNEPVAAAAFIPGSAAFEIYTVKGGRIAHVTAGGRVVAEEFLGSWSDSVIVVAAARASSGWEFLAREMNGDLSLVRPIPSERRQILHVFRRRQYSGDLPDSTFQLTGHFTISGDLRLVSLAWPPFVTAVLDSEGQLVRMLKPRHRAYTIDSTSLRTSAMVALPAIALDVGFLQTLADLRSDHREIILYDKKGREVRRTSLESPFAYVARAAGAPLLVAVRRSEVVELVLYEWAWIPVTTSNLRTGGVQ